MQECKFCGMPLAKDAGDDLCDFCKNDDGIEILANGEDGYLSDDE